MKRVLLLLTMVLAFNLSNAQDNPADVYVQVGSNMNLAFESSPNFTIGVGVQHKQWDGTLNYSQIVGVDAQDYSLSLNRVVELHSDVDFAFGALIGNVFTNGDWITNISNPYYSPSASIRVAPNSSKRIALITEVTLPQSFQQSEFNNEPQVSLKLRLNLQRQ